MTSLLSSALDGAARELEHRYASEEELAERRAQFETGGLRLFARQAWMFLEPRSTFVPNWHIDVICEHLELAFSREITRLLINIQPRVLKSTLVSVLAPTWRWTSTPSERFLTASYGTKLAIRDAVKSRALINSAWYQSNWGNAFHLTGDQNEKSRYTNDRTGYRISTSVGAGVTGEGGDVLILDDPNEQSDAQSEAARVAVKDWWGGTWATRLNDLDDGVKIVIQQRIHEEDLTGHILAEEGTIDEGGEWLHLCLPAEYEPAHPFVCPREIALPSGRTIAGDPRTEEGELLNPARVTRDQLDRLKITMGSQKATGQLQQRPSPAEGSILKRHWWRFYEHDRWPAVTSVVSYWDTSWKDKTTSDYVVGLVVGVAGANRYVLNRWRGQWGLVDAQAQIEASAAWVQKRIPNLPHTIYVEATANGPDIIAALRNTVPGIVSAAVKGDKTQRAHAVTPQLEAGQVFIPGHPDPSGTRPDDARTPAWALELVEECAGFPNASHDDQVDALTGCLLRASSPRLPSDTGEQEESPFGRRRREQRGGIRYGSSL